MTFKILCVKFLLNIYYGLSDIKFIERLENMNVVYIFKNSKTGNKILLKIFSSSKVDTIVFQNELAKYKLSPNLIKTNKGNIYIRVFKYLIFVQYFVEASSRRIEYSEMVIFFKDFYAKLDYYKNFFLETSIGFPNYKTNAISQHFSMIHGDLRPPNVIITANNFSVIDFEYLRLGVREVEVIKYIVLYTNFNNCEVEILYSKFMEAGIVEISLQESIRFLLFELLKSDFPEKYIVRITLDYYNEIISERIKLIEVCDNYLNKKKGGDLSVSRS